MLYDEGFFLVYKRNYIYRELVKRRVSLSFRNSGRVLASDSLCRLVGCC